MTAVTLAVVALVGTGATAAYAVTESQSNSLASLTVTAHLDGGDGRFVLSGRLTPTTPSGNCATNTAYLGWWIGSRSGGFHQTAEGTTQSFFDFFDAPSDGSVQVGVRAQGGCTGPDGLHPNLQLSITVDVDDLIRYWNDAISGTAYLGDDPATGAGQYRPAAGVTVDLLDVALGSTGAPVATATTGPDGVFWLVAPATTQEEADRNYKVRLRYDDGTVVYVDGEDMSAWRSSPAEWDAAADLGGPSDWFETTGYDAILATATEPSKTNAARLCNGAESESMDSAATAGVLWEAICETDPTFFNAALLSDQTSAAFARFGEVWFDQIAGAYSVTADRFTSDESGGVVTTTLHDDDIYLLDQDRTVDVTITRTFQGTDTRWVIEVRDSVTGELADVPFSFGGAFQNSMRTSWTRSPATSSSWVSDGGATRAVEEREAIIAHHAVAEAVDLHTDRENIQLTVEGGHLSYYLAVLDYTGCPVGAARTAALTIADDAPNTFGRERAPLSGDACTVTWPAPSVDPMTIGVPFDQTFTVDSSALGWAGGGTVDMVGLPDGLDYEVLDDIVPGVAPRYRIVGTPTTIGPFDIRVRAMNAVFREDVVHLIGTVSAPAPTAAITLNVGIGEEVDGATADVDGTGLQPDSGYEVVVESTPQTVGSGMIGADFLLDDTVTIPSGLEHGWHSITLSGTFADGTAVLERLWFRIAVDGTLAQVSPIAPADPGAGDPDGTAPADPGGQLATTGSDAAALLASAFLLLGVGAAVALRHQRVRRTGSPRES